MTDIERFEIDVPQADLDDLNERLARVRWTSPAPSDGYGVNLDEVRPLVEYWRERYDWRHWEARLNRYPQYAHSAKTPPPPSTFPLAVAGFAGDFSGVRHYAAHLEPDLMTDDIRGFYRGLR